MWFLSVDFADNKLQCLSFKSLGMPDSLASDLHHILGYSAILSVCLRGEGHK